MPDIARFPLMANFYDISDRRCGRNGLDWELGEKANVEALNIIEHWIVRQIRFVVKSH